MNPKDSIESLMSEALLRSGYLLETRIIKALIQNRFFVEPNQRILDPVTGKSREIDLIAELWDDVHDTNRKVKVCVSAHFICEAKNNPYPVVLLTELPFSPALAIWESLHEGKTGFFKEEHLDQSFFEYIDNKYKTYTQYCSFKPKKTGKNSELMALHPDDFHDDLEKIISYCRQEATQVSTWEDDYHRLFLYLPVVILGGALYIAEPQDDTMALTKVDAAFHMHFNIHDGHQNLSLVLFVTEGHFMELFQELVRLGQGIESSVAQKLIPGKTKS